MTATTRLLCSRCGQPIPNQRAAGVGEYVTGLRINRTGGGANQIRSWQGLGQWVCRHCVALGEAVPEADGLFT